VLVFLLVGLALFALVAAASAGRPYLFDEANFLFQARAIAETGIPHANMGYFGDRGRVTTREQYGLWHPPLYLYLLGLNVKLFGGAEAAARGMGIAIMLGTALVVYGLGHTLAGGGARGRRCGLVAVALFLVSPLVVQSAVVIDIDGTLLLLLSAAWVLAYLRWQDTAKPWRLAVLGALLALALWTKTTTPLALPVAVVVHQALAGRWRLGLRQAGVVLAVALPLFLGTWGLVAWATGMPFAMPFEWTAWELFDASRHTRGWLGDLARMRAEMAPPLAWVSPYLAGAFGALAAWRMAAWCRTRQAAPVDFLLVLGGAIFGVYFIKLAANFPKYHVAMMPYWSAALAWWATTWWEGTPARTRQLVVGLGLAAAVLHLALVRDAWQWMPTLVWEPLPLLPTAMLTVVTVAPAVRWAWRTGAGQTVPARFAGLPRNMARLRLGAAARLAPGTAAALLLALYGGWAVAVDLAQMQANYSTNYYYGARGQREAAAALDALGIDGPWIGAKEVAWYARNQRYIDADTFWWLVIAQGFRFEGQALGYDVPLVVPWTSDPHVRYFFEEHLSARYVQVGEVADYTIWVRRDTPLGVALAMPSRERPASD
jgi:4-amino-4-deoxy-L-arabinose transferase-like glycosyltransferase